MNGVLQVQQLASEAPASGSSRAEQQIPSQGVRPGGQPGRQTAPGLPSIGPMGPQLPAGPAGSDSDSQLSQVRASFYMCADWTCVQTTCHCGACELDQLGCAMLVNSCVDSCASGI